MEYGDFIFLAGKDIAGKWHYLVEYSIRNGRVTGYEYGKPNHLFIGSLAAEWQVAKVCLRYDTIKRFPYCEKTLNTATSPIRVRWSGRSATIN